MSKSQTPETDAEWRKPMSEDARGKRMFHHAKKMEIERDELLSRLTVIELRMPEELSRLEQERNAAQEWIKQAAPMLSKGVCIVIDEIVERLSEIEPCRVLLEQCPLDKDEWKEEREP